MSEDIIREATFSFPTKLATEVVSKEVDTLASPKDIDNQKGLNFKGSSNKRYSCCLFVSSNVNKKSKKKKKNLCFSDCTFFLHPNR